MEAELEQLYRDTVPKPGCPGTRIDSGGREWYSAAWIDYHPPLVEVATPVPSCPRCLSSEVLIGIDADDEATGEFECVRCHLEFDAD